MAGTGAQRRGTVIVTVISAQRIALLSSGPGLRTARTPSSCIQPDPGPIATRIKHIVALIVEREGQHLF
jgi:hypothetical protein